MIHLTCVAGGPLAHFKTKRFYTCRHAFVCEIALGSILSAREREVSRRAMLRESARHRPTKTLSNNFALALRRS